MTRNLLIALVIVTISLSINTFTSTSFASDGDLCEIEYFEEGKPSKISLKRGFIKKKFIYGLVLGCIVLSLRTLANPKSLGMIRSTESRFDDVYFGQMDTIQEIDSRKVCLINRQNLLWDYYNITIDVNEDMPEDYLIRLDQENYLPVKSRQITDEQGMIGTGTNGLAFLVIDKKRQELAVAKFPKGEEGSDHWLRSTQHMEQEFGNSKKWQAITGHSLNMNLEDDVIYKKFIYGKQLSHWMKSGKIFNDIPERRKLLEFYENMFSQHKQIMDLQYNNLVFDETLGEWLIIDGGGVLEFDTMDEALEVYLKNYRKKYTAFIRFYGDEEKKRQYYKDIDQLAKDVEAFAQAKKPKK